MFYDPVVYLRGRRSTRYLIDALGFEKHMRQIRDRRGEAIPDAWYERPYSYGTRLEESKIKGHGDTLFIPPWVKKPDYEFEIAGILLDAIRTQDLQEALHFVKTRMLYTIFNDMSARDFQADDVKIPLWVGPSKCILEKSFGPYFVPARCFRFDENGIPDIRMRLWINGELRCDNGFRSIYFSDPKSGLRRAWGFAQVITWFGSLGQGFRAGDILGSGTIGDGSIAEFAVKLDLVGKEVEPARYPWLKDGDIIRMEAGGIGALENAIRVQEGKQ